MQPTVKREDTTDSQSDARAPSIFDTKYSVLMSENRNLHIRTASLENAIAVLEAKLTDKSHQLHLNVAKLSTTASLLLAAKQRIISLEVEMAPLKRMKSGLSQELDASDALIATLSRACDDYKADSSLRHLRPYHIHSPGADSS